MLAGLIYRECVGGGAQRVPLPISCSLAKGRQHRTQNVLVLLGNIKIVWLSFSYPE